MEKILTAKNLYHSYNSKENILNNINIDIHKTDRLAIMGPSGSGKSTLLYCLCGMLKSKAGEVLYNDKDITKMSFYKLNKLYRKEFDFIFQDINLIPVLTVKDNILFKLKLNKIKIDNIKLNEILSSLSILSKINEYPENLSGGQRQRVAIARALVTEPNIIFADEPTGALDMESSRNVISELKKLREIGTSIVLVTHDPFIASQMDRVVFLFDGKIETELERPSIDEIIEVLKKTKTTFKEDKYEN
ncbi:putative ABC transport system ATP-binding protein [Peptoniphilus olsenii]|uniref:ABC transport system ATP-binding protein n=1 Tax=Peptoniphilus olsenii TaxID=411570 RepID=A0ABV2JB70_9FIRM